MTAAARDAAGAAIDRLRRGLPVAVQDGDVAVTLLSIELADNESLAAFDAPAPADVLLTGERAATLKLVNQLPAATPGPVRIERAPWLDLVAALALADPVADLANPLKGPWRTLAAGDDARALAAGIRLAKQARLLPALFVRTATAEDGPATPTAAIEQYGAASRLRIAARAKLPIAAEPDSTIVAFRAPGEEGEHLALIVGTPDMSAAPLVRLHSECLTGDLLGSLKCDCGPQLHAALAAMADAGGGVLLYLRQEGRGIGIVNKLRAYALQDQGFDTVDANLRLGFAVDERDFAVAARMLALLGIDRVRLLSNNPAKVAGLEAEGIAVAERVPLKVGEGTHNHAYLATKRDRTGHLL